MPRRTKALKYGSSPTLAKNIMANCLNYNCENLGDHEISIVNCGAPIASGFSNAIILECDHQVTDASDATQVQAEIDAGRAKLVKNIKAGINKASAEQTDPTTSCGVENLTTYNRAGIFKDFNVSENNIDFYNRLASGRSIGGLILFECETDGYPEKVTFIDKEIRFTGDRVVADTNKTPQVFDMDFAWKSLQMPTQHDAPPGIIDNN